VQPTARKRGHSVRVASRDMLLMVSPALCVWLVLLVGTRRVTPLLLDTGWSVELPQTAPCLPPGPSHLRMRASGERVELRFGEQPVKLTGRLTGDRLQAEGRGVRDHRCPDGRVALTARMVTGTGGETASMVGLLRPLGCDSCTPTPFHAVRR
jgi:hypothetical protein